MIRSICLSFSPAFIPLFLHRSLKFLPFVRDSLYSHVTLTAPGSKSPFEARVLRRHSVRIAGVPKFSGHTCQSCMCGDNPQHQEACIQVAPGLLQVVGHPGFSQADFGGVSLPRLFLGWCLREEQILTLWEDWEACRCPSALVLLP